MCRVSVNSGNGAGTMDDFRRPAFRKYPGGNYADYDAIHTSMAGADPLAWTFAVNSIPTAFRTAILVFSIG
jgi:hypothetical protein